jgi:hemerythrin-like metal-binding protein
VNGSRARAAMSTTFQWKENYSVKIVALDNHHQKRFELVKELHQAMGSGNGKDVVGDILCRVIEYTAHHFTAEDKLMEKHNPRDWFCIAWNIKP